MTLYLDASAAVSLFIDDVHSPRAKQLVDATSEQPLLSAWTAAEFASTVTRLWRGGSLTEPELDGVLIAFDSWRNFFAQDVNVDGNDVAIAALLVRDRSLKLRAPDALHVAICQRIGAALTTFDLRMRDAALALGIPLAPT